MDIFAHSLEKAPFEKWQKLSDHLSQVATLADEMAKKCNPALMKPAWVSGILHDFGKVRKEFQQYLCCKTMKGIETHHSIYGAGISFQNNWCGPAFAIAGHHSGLHDGHALQELLEKPSYKLSEVMDGIKEYFSKTVFPIPTELEEPSFVVDKTFSLEFYIRMIFSILVDADYLDTEKFYTGHSRELLSFNPQTLLDVLKDHVQSFPRAGELNQNRENIFQQCLSAAEKTPGFFSLTVPTGGGKTLSTMAFALKHALRNNLRRVIVVIPYLSIIEQNAAVYRNLFDPEKKGIVVEHHSAVQVDEQNDENRDYSKPAYELATENWDAPIIVTTSVQFLETLFAHKPAKCRKLHNIANSVIIFDEVQTLPTHLLNPCLNVFRELQKNYGVSILFSTATQPAFKCSSSLSEGFRDLEIAEIISDPPSLFQNLVRVEYDLSMLSFAITWDAMAEELAKHHKVLCVVNTRKHAFSLWQALRKLLSENERETLFHLSSAMCAQHRFSIFGEGERSQKGTVRNLLKHGETCRVISTQLIEAGVDVDFPAVFRAIGPLDSIVQAGGRCNREGLLKNENGEATVGKVFVFAPAEKGLPPGLYSTATGITSALLSSNRNQALGVDPNIFPEYFSQLFQLSATDFSRRGESSIQEDRAELRFRTVSGKAKVISQEGTPVVVPFQRGKEMIEEIRARQAIRGQLRFSRNDLRCLQRFMVNIQKKDFQILEGLKMVQPLLPNLELWVLCEGLYNQHLGLTIENRPTEDFLI